MSELQWQTLHHDFSGALKLRGMKPVHVTTQTHRFVTVLSRFSQLATIADLVLFFPPNLTSSGRFLFVFSAQLWWGSVPALSDEKHSRENTID